MGDLPKINGKIGKKIPNRGEGRGWGEPRKIPTFSRFGQRPLDEIEPEFFFVSRGRQHLAPTRLQRAAWRLARRHLVGRGTPQKDVDSDYDPPQGGWRLHLCQEPDHPHLWITLRSRRLHLLWIWFRRFPRSCSLSQKVIASDQDRCTSKRDRLKFQFSRTILGTDVVTRKGTCHACYKTTFSRLTSGASGLTLWTVWCTCLTATLKMSKALILWGSCCVFCCHAIEDWRLFIPLNQIFSCFLPRWVAVASYDNSQSDIDVMFEYKYPHFFIVIAVDFHIPSFITHHSW